MATPARRRGQSPQFAAYQKTPSLHQGQSLSLLVPDTAPFCFVPPPRTRAMWSGTYRVIRSPFLCPRRTIYGELPGTLHSTVVSVSLPGSSDAFAARICQRDPKCPTSPLLGLGKRGLPKWRSSRRSRCRPRATTLHRSHASVMYGGGC